jgi:GNAT superfamily N-acetyltransferase
LETGVKQGVFPSQGLTEQDALRVKELQSVCNRFEHLEIPVDLEMTSSLSKNETNQFLYYESGQLIGFLSFVGGGNQGVEVSVMVHPKHRRKEIASSLLGAAKYECKRRGFLKWLLVCEEASVSGRAFLRAIGAQYRFSEYGMKLEAVAVNMPQPIQSPLVMERAEVKDVNVLAHLTAVSFNDSEEKVRRRMAERIQESTHRFYIAKLNGEPIGSLGVVTFEATYIIAFGVLPEHRGRGYGRQMLAWTVGTLLSQKHRDIFIEVVTDNQNALSLYRSCGFKEITTYGYYHMDI